MHPVAVLRTKPDKDAVFETVAQVMDLADWKSFISPGADVSLKPNLSWDKLIPGATSGPWVFEAVIHHIRSYVGHIYVVESDQVVVDVEDALAISGIGEVVRRTGVTWVNMSKGGFVHMEDPERLILKHIYIPEILTRTELITVAMLKTHNKSTVTGAIKNQWGCLQTLRHNYHMVLSQALVDVNTLVKPRFAVMDGTIGLEGNGPKSGRPRQADVVLASGNLVGIDATAARIMGFDPEQIDHLILCEEHGLGTINPDLKGVPIAEIRQEFTPAKHNPVSWLELMLRQSFFERLVFHTFVLKIMSWGARRYYDLWDFFVGRDLRKQLWQNSPVYARQWINTDEQTSN